MLNADHINYQLTAESFAVDPVLTTNTVSFTLCDQSGNDIVDQSGNLIGGNTSFESHNIKLTAPHIDYVLTVEA